MGVVQPPPTIGPSIGRRGDRVSRRALAEEGRNNRKTTGVAAKTKTRMPDRDPKPDRLCNDRLFIVGVLAY